MSEKKRGRDLTDLERQIIEKGIEVGAFLDPVFKDACKELHDLFKDAIVTTQPHEEKKREMLYYLNAALTDLETLLNAAVIARAQVEAEALADEQLAATEMDNF